DVAAVRPDSLCSTQSGREKAGPRGADSATHCLHGRGDVCTVAEIPLTDTILARRPGARLQPIPIYDAVSILSEARTRGAGPFSHHSRRESRSDITRVDRGIRQERTR